MSIYHNDSTMRQKQFSFLNPEFSKARNVLELTALRLRKKANLFSAFKSMPTTFQDSFKRDVENGLATQQSYVLTRHYHRRFTQLSDNNLAFYGVLLHPLQQRNNNKKTLPHLLPKGLPILPFFFRKCYILIRCLKNCLVYSRNVISTPNT